MRYLIYSTKYKKNIGDLSFIIEDYYKVLNNLKKYPNISRKYIFIEVGPEEIDKIRIACSKRYYVYIKQLYESSEDYKVKNHIYDELIGCRGTMEALKLALGEKGVVYHLGGGYHHASRSRAGGFDYLNDIVYAIESCRSTMSIERVLIIDLDVHFPDGIYDTYYRDENIYLFSIHGWGIFPGRGWIYDCGIGKAKYTKWNIPLPKGITGHYYLEALYRFLPEIISMAEPEVVIYQAGVDVLHNDELGNLRLTLKDVYLRDKYVYEEVVKRNKLPLVVVAGGGYSLDTYKARINTLAALGEEDLVFDDTLTLTCSAQTIEKYNKWCSMVEALIKKAKNKNKSQDC